VSLRRDGADLSARIELQDAAGKTLGVQEIRSRAANCTELAAALELTLSMVLDARASDVAGPPPTTAIATATPKPNPKPSDSGPKLGVGLGVLAAFAAAPTTVAAVSLGIEARWPSYSLGLEGRLDFPSKLAVAEGYVQSSLWMATLVPCLRYHWLAACGLLAAGVQSAEAIGVEGGVAASAAYLAPGARLALAVPLGPVFSAQLRTDLLIPIVRTSIYAGAESVWTTPPASFAAGVTVAAQISR